jgi:hypothetical protein
VEVILVSPSSSTCSSSLESSLLLLPCSSSPSALISVGVIQPRRRGSQYLSSTNWASLMYPRTASLGLTPEGHVTLRLPDGCSTSRTDRLWSELMPTWFGNEGACCLFFDRDW